MHAPSPASGQLAPCTAPVVTPWFHPPQSVWNHDNIRSTTVVLESRDYEVKNKRRCRDKLWHYQIIMISLGWLGSCSASHTPRENSRPTPLKYPLPAVGRHPPYPHDGARSGS